MANGKIEIDVALNTKELERELGNLKQAIDKCFEGI